MDRRTFVRSGALLGAAGVARPDWLMTGQAPSTPGLRSPVAPDWILRNAVLADGTGGPLREGDVAVRGGRIAAVGTVAGTGAEELDLKGLVLAPGFIDIHSHADLNLLIEPRAESRIRQGVTLEVVGQDGSSILWDRDRARRTAERFARAHGVRMDFRDLGGFLDHLDRNPVAVNVASMVGHGSIRGRVVGGADRPATEAELEAMTGLVREALAQGAVGLSSGLEYTPGAFAPPAELVRLARELRGTGLPYASHMRNEDDRLLTALEETLQVGRDAGVPVQVSHLKAQGRRNWWKAELALEMLEAARGRGLDVAFDRYPYVAYATGLSSLFPPEARAGGIEALLRRASAPDTGPELEGRTRAKVGLLGGWDQVQVSSTGPAVRWARGRRLGTLARRRGVDPYRLTLDILRADGGATGMIGFGMSEENTARLLSHPLAMVCSDGGAYAPYGPLSSGSPHPRGYGTFPRFLGRYVRERGDLPLAAAIHRITGMPAARLGLAHRGVLRPGAAADLVAFDPDRVEDRATFESPHAYPQGIVHVLVNGGLTLRAGEQTGVLRGRSVRGPAYRGG